MDKTSFSAQRRRERRFILLTFAAAIFCAALAFWFAVPLQAAPDRSFASKDLSVYLRVDLNTAGVEELCALPGIGKSTAEKIVQDREQNGRYRRVEDVLRVSGVTQTILDSWNGMAQVTG